MNKWSCLKAGDVIELERWYNVYTIIKGKRKPVTINDEFDYLIGRYVVTKTAYGGGTCSHCDIQGFDGHHVFYEKLNDPQKTKVDFYQSGSFTAVILVVHPVGKAVKTLFGWSEVKDE